MHRVVIVGGGVAGSVLATHLARRLSRRGIADILLIDRNPAHVWKPMLHTFAAGTAIYANENISFVSLAKRNRFRYWPGALEGLDRTTKEVKLGPIRLPDGHSELPGRAIPYDTLVVSVGSRANDFHIDGVQQHCNFIDDIGEAERFSALLRTRIMQAVDAGRDIHVAIVGGGATGVELAAELRLTANVLARYETTHVASKLRITLIETGPRVLSAFPERISHQVEAKLRDLRVEVRTGTKVVAADKTGVTIEGGEHLDTDITAWVAGVKGPDALSRLDGLPLTRSGQLKVRPTLQVESDDSVFAMGDSASFPGTDGKPLPTTAQVARQQAVFLARSLGRHLHRGRPLADFYFNDRGKLVSLGDFAAYGTLGTYGFFGTTFIKGKAAELAHAALYRMHEMDLRGVVRGGAGWLASDVLRATRPRARLG